MSLVFVGDVHGKFKAFIKIVSPFRHSFCVGDVGFIYNELSVLHHYSHKMIAGNHDNYSARNGETEYHKKYFMQPYHFLGDYGVHTIPEYGEFFFVRGAWSIDRKHRIPGLSWWVDEELDRETGALALSFYQDIKPKYVVTHECPFEVLAHLDLDPEFARDFGHKDSCIKTKTNQLLQSMLDFHRPKLWIFGHFHKSFDKVIDGTRFICLPELGTLSFQDCQEFWRWLK